MPFTLPALALASFNCPVLVVPASADQKWNDAAKQAAAHTSQAGSTESDCKAIVVNVNDKGAQLTMTTTDGRRATRPIHTPDEILPVTRALIVTLPPVAKSTEERSDSAPASSPENSKQGSAPANEHSMNGKRGWGVILMAGAGARLANRNAGLTPLGSLGAGVSLGRFEMGVFGSREFGYHRVSGTAPTGFSLSATSVELFAGVRQPAGPVELIGGVNAGPSFVTENSTVDCNNAPDATNCADGPLTRHVTELRAGAYVATAVPLTARFRLRPELDFSLVAAQFHDDLPSGYTVPSLPSWGAALRLAIEGSVL